MAWHGAFLWGGFGALASLGLAAPLHSKVRVRPLDTQEVPAPRKPLSIPSGKFALRNLEFDWIRASHAPPAFQKLSQLLQAVFEGRPKEALVRAQILADTSTGGIQEITRSVRDALLFHEEQYGRVLQFAKKRGASADPFLEALSLLPRHTVVFENASPFQELVADKLEVPQIQVLAHGQLLACTLDTGAVLTTLTRSKAKELGVQTISEIPVQIGTSTEIQVEAVLGFLKTLKVGAALFRNHPVLVVSDETLSWKDRAGNLQKLEAVLGWNAIRYGRAVLDFPRRRFQFHSPDGYATSQKNFFWLGYPMVRARSTSKVGLLFGLDSGSRNTSVSANLFSKMPHLRYRKETRRVIGFGGSQTKETRVLDALSLQIRGYQFDWKDVPEESYDDAVFVSLDGVLGSDVSRSLVLTIDFQNSVYSHAPAGP